MEHDHYSVALSPAARRSLFERLPEGVAGAIIDFLRGDLSRAPYRVGKPLREDLAGYYAARRGAYRVVYSVHDDRRHIEVIRIDHRRHVYRA